MPTTDTLTVRIVVSGLVLLSLLGVAAVTWLLWTGVGAERVAIVTSLVGPAVGGLVGILASTRSVPAGAGP